MCHPVMAHLIGTPLTCGVIAGEIEEFHAWCVGAEISGMVGRQWSARDEMLELKGVAIG